MYEIAQRIECLATKAISDRARHPLADRDEHHGEDYGEERPLRERPAIDHEALRDRCSGADVRQYAQRRQRAVRALALVDGAPGSLGRRGGRIERE